MIPHSHCSAILGACRLRSLQNFCTAFTVNKKNVGRYWEIRPQTQTAFDITRVLLELNHL